MFSNAFSLGNFSNPSKQFTNQHTNNHNHFLLSFQPVFDEQGQVVGVASSHLRGAGNIGYIVPGKIVAMFLQMCIDGMEIKIEDCFSGLGDLVVRGSCHPQDGLAGNSSCGGVNMSGMATQPKHVPGIPNLAIHGSQNLESKALRRSLGLEEMDILGGVRIVGVRKSVVGGSKSECEKEEELDVNAEHGSENDNTLPSETTKEEPSKDIDDEVNNNHLSHREKLQANDVLLAINNIPIGMDGTIQLSPTRPDERINFRSLVTCQRVGSKVILDVLRERKYKKLEVILDTCRFLVPQYDDFDACPLYAVCGGCVFCKYRIMFNCYGVSFTFAGYSFCIVDVDTIICTHNFPVCAEFMLL